MNSSKNCVFPARSVNIRAIIYLYVSLFYSTIVTVVCSVRIHKNINKLIKKLSFSYNVFYLIVGNCPPISLYLQSFSSAFGLCFLYFCRHRLLDKTLKFFLI